MTGLMACLTSVSGVIPSACALARSFASSVSVRDNARTISLHSYRTSNTGRARDAVSLGGVETLACHPRSTTHSAWSAKDLDEAGIGEGLVRVSFGIEDWQDLLHDFEQALERA
jgi:O-acetylhomoserine/O-acetylserine sulfhydrylase-like pyridoxal-dependent enzyme